MFNVIIKREGNKERKKVGVTVVASESVKHAKYSHTLFHTHATGKSVRAQNRNFNNPRS